MDLYSCGKSACRRTTVKVTGRGSASRRQIKAKAEGPSISLPFTMAHVYNLDGMSSLKGDQNVHHWFCAGKDHTDHEDHRAIKLRGRETDTPPCNSTRGLGGITLLVAQRSLARKRTSLWCTWVNLQVACSIYLTKIDAYQSLVVSLKPSSLEITSPKWGRQQSHFGRQCWNLQQVLRTIVLGFVGLNVKRWGRIYSKITEQPIWPWRRSLRMRISHVWTARRSELWQKKLEPRL